jgi:glutathione S-transferase
MQLFCSTTSPWSYKVRVTAHEKGLHNRIQLHICAPLEDPPSLLQVNPLGKIPALVLDNGVALYDSPVICEYLDSLNRERLLIPAHGDERWAVLRAQALADGLLDVAVAQVYELRRIETERSPAMLARWHRQMSRAVDEMASQLGNLPPELNLGHIAFGCALAYLDLRFTDLGWRAAQPVLATWFADFGQRESMRATRPA